VPILGLLIDGVKNILKFESDLHAVQEVYAPSMQDLQSL